MPPKTKARNKAEKLKKNAGKNTASNGGRVLRPKKGTDFKRLNSGSKPAKVKTAKPNEPEKVQNQDDEVSLSAGSDFDMSSDDVESGEKDHGNMSNSATPDSANGNESDPDHEDISDENKRGDDHPSRLTREVERVVGACMKQYAKQNKSKKKRAKRRRRRGHDYSSSDDSDSDSSESNESTDSYESSSDNSYRKDRRKRKKRSSKKKKRSGNKSSGKTDHTVGIKANGTVDSPSQSTVYTRGCKSPERPVITGSSDTDSQRSGHIDSEADTEEFMNSLQNSINHSTPIADRRQSKNRSPVGRKEREDDPDEIRERRLAEQAETSRREAAVRDRADDVIRDIQRNKADLAKPTGEWQRELETILIDMRHFHLISHVDRKVRNQILEGDFTVEFKRLVPQSRSHCKTDQRLQMVNKDGMSCFVPADRDNFKDITSYKQWEVAFKVFMGILVSKWGDRAQELLQYSHTIQNASLTYPWENVYNYDIAIREIMTDNPGRLWSRICHHTWHLELGEPTNKVGFQPSSSGNNPVSRGQRKICWKFNKGRCNYGSNCEYDHRCSVCGGRNHGRSTCYKRGKTTEKTHDRRDVKKEKN